MSLLTWKYGNKNPLTSSKNNNNANDIHTRPVKESTHLNVN